MAHWALGTPRLMSLIPKPQGAPTRVRGWSPEGLSGPMGPPEGRVSWPPQKRQRQPLQGLKASVPLGGSAGWKSLARREPWSGHPFCVVLQELWPREARGASRITLTYDVQTWGRASVSEAMRPAVFATVAAGSKGTVHWFVCCRLGCLVQQDPL